MQRSVNVAAASDTSVLARYQWLQCSEAFGHLLFVESETKPQD
jgi:hypothetical protein